mgnify:CR=1 FL=1
MATKEKIEEWKRLGLCSHCGKNKVSDGYLTCQECRDKDKANRDYKREHGLCVKCGRNHVAPNRKYCDDCLKWRQDRYNNKEKGNKDVIAIRKERYQKRKERQASNRLCIWCNRPAFENHSLCYEHLVAARNRTRRDRALAKEFKGE